MIEETEAKNVRWIFSRFLEIGSATELARDVARRGIRTPCGNLMKKNFLYQLQKPFYHIDEVLDAGACPNAT